MTVYSAPQQETILAKQEQNIISNIQSNIKAYQTIEPSKQFADNRKAQRDKIIGLFDDFKKFIDDTKWGDESFKGLVAQAHKDNILSDAKKASYLDGLEPITEGNYATASVYRGIRKAPKSIINYNGHDLITERKKPDNLGSSGPEQYISAKIGQVVGV